MSTNKTQHYHLHAWTAGDAFLRTEINENFAMLDTAVKTEADVLDAVLKAEVNARAAAVTAETDARTAAVTAEVNARKSAVSGEASARTSAINAAKNELKGQISALSTTLQSRGQLVVGSYVGNYTTNREIKVGAPILALFLENTFGLRQDIRNSLTIGGLILPGYPLRSNGCRIEGSSFFVSSKDSDDWVQTNRSDITYLYFAWVEDN